MPYGGEIVIVADTTGNQYKFTGKERDTETDLDYFGARYYAHSFMRFMTPDWAATPVPIPYAQMGIPQTLNLYSYVQNNPITSTDPDGHFESSPCGDKECFSGDPFGTGGAPSSGQEIGQSLQISIIGGTKESRERLMNLYVWGYYATNSEFGKLVDQHRQYLQEHASTATLPDGSKVSVDWGPATTTDIEDAYSKVSRGKSVSLKLVKAAASVPTSGAGFVSRGSTGRTTPNSLKEKLAMDQAKSNPVAGKKLSNIKMNDSRWPASKPGMDKNVTTN